MDRKRRLMENNNGWPLRNQLFDGAPIALPLTHTVIGRGGLTPSFTRATTETGQKWDEAGYLDFTALAGEIVWKGARRERNLLGGSTVDFNNASWTKIFGGAGSIPVVTSGFTDPDGGAGAWRLQADRGGAGAANYSILRNGNAAGGNQRAIYIKSNTGSSQVVYFGAPASGQGQAVTATTSWQPLSVPLNANVNYDIGTYGAIAESTQQSIDVLIWHPQFVDITGETDQTTIRPYVSVGVASDWWGTDLVTNGTFDTDTTGWTAVNSTLSVVSGRLRVTNVGAVNGYAYQAITTVIGQKYVLIFDGTMGSSSSFSIYVGNSPGAGTLGGAGPLTANGSARVEFTATATTTYLSCINLQAVDTRYDDYDNIVVKPAVYFGSMVDGVKCFDTDRSGNPISTTGSYPLVGYVPWEARTNSLLHARDLSNAAWVKVNCTGVKDAVGSDGVPNSASTLTATGANATILQTLVLAAAARSYSVKIKRKTGTGTVSICRDGVTFTNVTSQINSSTYTTVKIENTSVLNPVCGIKLDTSGDAVYVDWNQDEAGAFITPPIATTTVAVARNASVLTYTGVDVANIKTLACTFSRGVGVSNVGITLALTDGTGNEFVQIQQPTATSVRFVGGDGGVTQWDVTASNAYSPGSTSKASQSFATNAIKMDKDGIAQAADTTATIPTVSQVCVGHFNGSFQTNGPVNHVYGWTRNLSQSELGAIDR